MVLAVSEATARRMGSPGQRDRSPGSCAIERCFPSKFLTSSSTASPAAVDAESLALLELAGSCGVGGRSRTRLSASLAWAAPSAEVRYRISGRSVGGTGRGTIFTAVQIFPAVSESTLSHGGQQARHSVELYLAPETTTIPGEEENELSQCE